MWYIIVNPASGNGKVKQKWPKIEQILQVLEISYTVQFTERRGHAIHLVDNAVLKGHRNILGIGGDGTNHEICNGILTQKHCHSSEINYALLPVGTGNDWARQYAISHDIRKRLLCLKEPKTVLQDAGFVQYQRDGQPQQRFFVNVAGLAYDAFVVKKLEEKPIKSKIVYLLSAVKFLMDYTPLKAFLLYDDKITKDFFYTINVGICKYSGGGMQFVPQAVPDDGLLAFTFARNMPKWEVLMQTLRFYRGTIHNHPLVEGFSVKKIQIEAMRAPVLLEADGEFLGETPCIFEIREKVLRVVL
jgi:diacylglycerol kinase (ATP)